MHRRLAHTLLGDIGATNARLSLLADDTLGPVTLARRDSPFLGGDQFGWGATQPFSEATAPGSPMQIRVTSPSTTCPTWLVR